MSIDELELLVRGLLDFFPWPVTWTGELQARSASPGPAPFAEDVVCRTCRGSRRLANGRTCHECKGHGRWNYDAYVGRMFEGENWAIPSDQPVRQRERQRDGDRVVDAMQMQRERREHGSVYLAIVRAVDELAPGTRWLLVMTYVLSDDGYASPAARAALELVHQAVEEVRPPRWVTELLEQRRASLAAAKGKTAAGSAQRQRDAEIRRLAAEGWTHQEIAARFQLSRVRVTQVLKRDARAADGKRLRT